MKVVRNGKEYAKAVQEELGVCWPDMHDAVNYAYKNFGRPVSYPCIVTSHRGPVDPDDVWGPEIIIGIWYSKNMSSIISDLEVKIKYHKDLLKKLRVKNK